MAEEKILTVNLRKKLLKGPRWKRNKYASRILRDILKRQTKSDKVKIDKELNEKIWRTETPPAKLRIKLTKLDDDSFRAELVK